MTNQILILLIVLFAIFGKAHTFCQSKDECQGQLCILKLIFRISAFTFSNQKAGPPLPLTLELNLT